MVRGTDTDWSGLVATTSTDTATVLVMSSCAANTFCSIGDAMTVSSAAAVDVVGRAVVSLAAIVEAATVVCSVVCEGIAVAGTAFEVDEHAPATKHSAIAATAHVPNRLTGGRTTWTMDEPFEGDMCIVHKFSVLRSRDGGHPDSDAARNFARTALEQQHNSAQNGRRRTTAAATCLGRPHRRTWVPFGLRVVRQIERLTHRLCRFCGVVTDAFDLLEH